MLAELESEVIREVERGYYAKAQVGSTMYLATFGGIVRPGSALAIAFGNDFIDHENNSMAWEVSLYQGVHNGDALRGAGSQRPAPEPPDPGRHALPSR